ncbi:MAG: hypothetical protein NT137_01040 [Methanomassiliicoccales archaeon]|nr:hypothetical protein [Methanomassiliicoccales archaeon]
MLGIMVMVAALAHTVMPKGSQNNDGDDGQNSPHIPRPDIRYVSATLSQNPISGDVTVNVKVTDFGDTIGSKTIQVAIYEPSGTYINSKSVSLAPVETSTVSVIVNTPFGTGVSSDMIESNLN